MARQVEKDTSEAIDLISWAIGDLESQGILSQGHLSYLRETLTTPPTYILSLKIIMSCKDMRDTDLARTVGISRSYLSRILSHERRLLPETSKKIANALNLSETTTAELEKLAILHNQSLT